MRGNHISLFSGVGMTDLAAEALGFKTVATAEIDPFCQSVLSRRFPDAVHFPDVQSVSLAGIPGFGSTKGDLLMTGGFPCQGVSAIGHGKGLADARSGLWSEFARCINAFSPEHVLIENSPLLRSRGLDRILLDLYSLGYDARWDCIPAAFVGAPHLRDRIYIYAHPRSGPPCIPQNPVGKLPRAGQMIGGAYVPRTSGSTIKQARDEAKRLNRTLWPTARAAPNDWRTTKNAPSHGTSHGKTLSGEVNDQERARGVAVAQASHSAGNMNPAWVEWLMGLPEGWTDPEATGLWPFQGWSHEPTIPRTLYPVKDRRSRLTALGNGLVPQVAQYALTHLSEGAIQWP